mgnify:CR=1 FL=1
MAEARKRAGEKGTIVQIIGAVVDVEFAENAIPELYDALDIKGDGKQRPDNNKSAAALYVVSPWVHLTVYAVA